MAVKHLGVLPDELEDRLSSYRELDEILAYDRIMARLEHEAYERARKKGKQQAKTIPRKG